MKRAFLMKYKVFVLVFERLSFGVNIKNNGHKIKT